MVHLLPGIFPLACPYHNDLYRKCQLDRNQGGQLVNGFHLPYVSQKQQAQKAVSDLRFHVLFLGHGLLGKMLCHIDLQKIGHVQHLLLASEDAHHSNQFVLQKDGHVIALLCSGIPGQILCLNKNRFSRGNDLSRALVEGTDAFLFRGGDNGTFPVHDIDGASSHQGGCGLHEILCHTGKF